jgi:hypothetical protein
MSEPERVTEEPAEPIEVTDADVDEAIAMCGGDPRAAVKTLLIAGQFLERELEEARQEASWGYIRGRPSRCKEEGT